MRQWKKAHLEKMQEFINTVQSTGDINSVKQDELLLAPRDPRTENMCITPASQYDWSPSTMEAYPRIIHQVWVGPYRQPDDCLKMQAYAFKHGYAYRLWTDGDIDELCLDLPPHVRDVITNNLRSKRVRGASNVMRYCAIYKYGGIYFDADYVPRQDCLAPHEFIPTTGLSATTEWGARQIGADCGSLFLENSLICSAPGHSMLKRCIDSTSKNDAMSIEQWGGVTTLGTGPFLFTACAYGCFSIIVPRTLYAQFDRVNHNGNLQLK